MHGEYLQFSDGRFAVLFHTRDSTRSHEHFTEIDMTNSEICRVAEFMTISE